MQSRMLSRPARILTKRSSPKARPACGGAPYLKAFIKKPNWASARSGVKPSTSNIFSCNLVSWIRKLPPPTSIPLHTKSYALALTCSGCSSSNGISSGLGIVKGWCVAIRRCSSSLHSKRGKSTIHKHLKTFLSIKPKRLPISRRSEQSCVRVLFGLSPDKINTRSPLLAPIASFTLARSSVV